MAEELTEEQLKKLIEESGLKKNDKGNYIVRGEKSGLSLERCKELLQMLPTRFTLSYEDVIEIAHMDPEFVSKAMCILSKYAKADKAIQNKKFTKKMTEGKATEIKEKTYGFVNEKRSMLNSFKDKLRKTGILLSFNVTIEGKLVEAEKIIIDKKESLLSVGELAGIVKGDCDRFNIKEDQVLDYIKETGHFPYELEKDFSKSAEEKALELVGEEQATANPDEFKQKVQEVTVQLVRRKVLIAIGQWKESEIIDTAEEGVEGKERTAGDTSADASKEVKTYAINRGALIKLAGLETGSDLKFNICVVNTDETAEGSIPEYRAKIDNEKVGKELPVINIDTEEWESVKELLEKQNKESFGAIKRGKRGQEVLVQLTDEQYETLKAALEKQEAALRKKKPLELELVSDKEIAKFKRQRQLSNANFIAKQVTVCTLASVGVLGAITLVVWGGFMGHYDRLMHKDESSLSARESEYKENMSHGAGYNWVARPYSWTHKTKEAPAVFDWAHASDNIKASINESFSDVGITIDGIEGITAVTKATDKDAASVGLLLVKGHLPGENTTTYIVNLGSDSKVMQAKSVDELANNLGKVSLGSVLGSTKGFTELPDTLQTNCSSNIKNLIASKLGKDKTWAKGITDIKWDEIVKDGNAKSIVYATYTHSNGSTETIVIDSLFTATNLGKGNDSQQRSNFYASILKKFNPMLNGIETEISDDIAAAKDNSAVVTFISAGLISQVTFTNPTKGTPADDQPKLQSKPTVQSIMANKAARSIARNAWLDTILPPR